MAEDADKTGKDFERAVHRFVQSLDPSAQVLFDQKVPDVGSRTPRQVDVLVKATVLRNIPIKILISCKDHGRPLHIGDMTTFWGEVMSAGVSTGIIYSPSGFTGPALQKAEAHGLVCCHLYRDEPPEVPERLWLKTMLCAPRIGVGVKNFGELAKQYPLWAQLLDRGLSTADGERKLIDIMAQVFHAGEKWSVEQLRPGDVFPPAWQTELKVDDAIIVVKGVWRHFRGRLESHLLNGQYCYANQTFFGSQGCRVSTCRAQIPGRAGRKLIHRSRRQNRRCSFVSCKGPMFRRRCGSISRASRFQGFLRIFARSRSDRRGRQGVMPR